MLRYYKNKAYTREVLSRKRSKIVSGEDDDDLGGCVKVSQM